MRLFEMFQDSTIAKKYPVTMKYYDTQEVIHDLETQISMDYIQTPLRYTNLRVSHFNLRDADITYAIENEMFSYKALDPHVLISIQQTVRPEQVLLAMEDVHIGKNDYIKFNQYPIVLHRGTTNYLYDGNHRAVAALWSNKRVECRVIECEEDEEP